MWPQRVSFKAWTSTCLEVLSYWTSILLTYMFKWRPRISSSCKIIFPSRTKRFVTPVLPIMHVNGIKDNFNLNKHEFGYQSSRSTYKLKAEKLGTNLTRLRNKSTRVLHIAMSNSIIILATGFVIPRRHFSIIIKLLS